MKALKKGMVLPDHKYGSLSTTKIQILPAPRFVALSLVQASGTVLNPLVHEGDEVLVGTKIAEHSDLNSVPLHASVSGRISQVSQDTILIESNEADKFEPSIRIQNAVPTDPDQLIELIRQAGIVDLGGTGLPVHLRLAQARDRKVDTLVINGCESEPFLTSDHVLMLNHPVEILKGTELLRTIIGARRAVIATERNKLEVVEILNTKNYNLKLSTVETVHFPVRYPQGSERALAESVLGKELDRKQTAIEAGVLVENVATVFAIYEAVYLNKPLYERVVTIAGSCVIEPKNVWARIGTRAQDLIRSAKGMLRQPGRLLFGGPMTGEAIDNLEKPITKNVTAILALAAEIIASGKEEACTRCGTCVDVCPESLMPETLMKAARQGNQKLLDDYDVNSCTECGLCSYVCPSYIPLAQVIKSAKTVRKQDLIAPAYAVLPQTQS